MERILHESESGGDTQSLEMWELVYDPRRNVFTVFDTEGNLIKNLFGAEARNLKGILTCKKQDISQDAIAALKPLLKDAFPEDFDESGEGYSYQLDLAEGQKQGHPKEVIYENIERICRGTLAPKGIKAKDVAEVIIKGEKRVRISLALGSIGESEVNRRIEKLASEINPYFSF